MSLYHKLRRKIFPEHPGFTPQFRLEAVSRDRDNEDALAMRVADPLWMLGRQWQFGEFKGEDNGSPISVSVNCRKEAANFYSLANNEHRYPINETPLEARVEAMQATPKDLRSKVRVGQKFEDLIREAFSATKANTFIRNLRREFPLTRNEKLDGKSERFFDLMAGSVIDGGTLWEQIQKNEFPGSNFSELTEVTQRLKEWYETLFLPPAADSAWQSKQLLHKFKVHHQGNAAGEDFTLSAPDYQSGHLDWYSFDSADIGINNEESVVRIESLIPVNASFAAMPDNRLFSFEDSQLDLSGMDLEKTDLVKMMLIDFSLVSGSDWYTIPIEMSLGELCWINSLEVKDVFGVTTIINNDKDTGKFLSDDGLKVWDVFKIRDKNVADFIAKDHFLLLAPATTFRMESNPLEEVLFLRDEFANMVWAIEKTVCSDLGKPTNGFDLHLELNGPFLKQDNDEEPTDGGIPKYRLASPVPTNWIPYLPFQIEGSNTEIELKRAFMMRNEDQADPVDIIPLTTLAKEDILTIREEAIPRAGVRVQITRQRVRWTDGKTYIWMGRKVLAGKGEGSSDLTFDKLLV